LLMILIRRFDYDDNDVPACHVNDSLEFTDIYLCILNH
jgi:hypothetical protein